MGAVISVSISISPRQHLPLADWLPTAGTILFYKYFLREDGYLKQWQVSGPRTLRKSAREGVSLFISDART